MADTAFVSTAHIHRGDTSCDTSQDIHKHTETDDVRRTFGQLGGLSARGTPPAPHCTAAGMLPRPSQPGLDLITDDLVAGERLLVRPAAEPTPDLDDELPPRFTETDPVELGEAFDDAGLGGSLPCIEGAGGS